MLYVLLTTICEAGMSSIQNKIALHHDIPWISLGVGVCSIECCIILKAVDRPLGSHVVGNIHYPRFDWLTITPAPTAIEPCAMFIGNSSLWNMVCATKLSACAKEEATSYVRRVLEATLRAPRCLQLCSACCKFSRGELLATSTTNAVLLCHHTLLLEETNTKA